MDSVWLRPLEKPSVSARYNRRVYWSSSQYSGEVATHTFSFESTGRAILLSLFVPIKGNWCPHPRTMQSDDYKKFLSARLSEQKPFSVSARGSTRGLYRRMTRSQLALFSIAFRRRLYVISSDLILLFVCSFCTKPTARVCTLYQKMGSFERNPKSGSPDRGYREWNFPGAERL